jgi:S-adenosylmethionine synthetase
MIPPASFIAKKIAIEVGALRRKGDAPFLRPDGKTLVHVEVDAGCTKVRQIVVSAQHVPEALPEQVSRTVRSILSSCVQGAVVDEATELTINPPSGRFCFGGPAADTGLTGRKVVADCYGPSVPHGGGSFSGKDPTKIDRCGAYAARWVAKSLVMSGVAATAWVNLSYVIGVAEPIVVAVFLSDGDPRQESQITSLIRDKFDLRAGAIIERLGLVRPLYLRATMSAHFGVDSTLPWEQARTDL